MTPETPREEPLEGRIAQGIFPGVLRRLYLQHRTGLLQISDDKDRCSVCFIDGRIAWGQASMAECQLGAVLVRHGIVSQEVLDQVFDLVGGGKRLGDLLIELGSMDRATLDDALALQVRETLLAAFAWLEGAWRFEDHPADRFKGYDHELRISTGDLILDAVWSVGDPDLVRYALGNLDRSLGLTTDPMLRYQRLNLTPTDGLLLSHVDGLRTAREVLSLMPSDALETERCLLGLLCTGIIEPVSAQSAAATPPEQPLTREEVLREHASLASRDHFQMLRLPTAASEKDAAAAWVRLARRFHPDSQTDPALASLRAQREAILARMGVAASVLTDPARRSAYESALLVARLGGGSLGESELTQAPPAAPAAVDFQSAEDVLTQAETEYAEGRYWDALQALEVVFESLSPKQRSRALMLRARVYAKNPKWMKEAEEQLKQVLASEPANAEAYFLLGQVYKSLGVGVRAEAMFRRVLQLKPRHAGALAEQASTAKAKDLKA